MQIEQIDIGSVVRAAVDSANAMCDPARWFFEWDMPAENEVDIRVSRWHQGFCSLDEYHNACGYVRDLSKVVLDLLRRYADEGWSDSSTQFVLNSDESEIYIGGFIDPDDEPSEYELKHIVYVGQKFFLEEGGVK